MELFNEIEIENNSEVKFTERPFFSNFAGKAFREVEYSEY